MRAVTVLLGAVCCCFVVVVVDASAPTTTTISVPSYSDTQPFPHVWEACVGSGHAALGLRQDWREHLAMVRKDLGFQRVRFHGVFDDDMNVVLPSGTSFYNVFSVYDYILSLGMTPYVELGFTPGALRSNNDTIMWYKAYISMPDQLQWMKLVSSFATALIDRYGLDVVSTFYFEVFNEFNCGFLSAPDPKMAYYSLYNFTAVALKSVNAALHVGGPVTCMSAYVDDFLAWTRLHGVPVDFVATHEYPTDPAVVGGDMIPVFKSTLQQVRASSATLPLVYSEFNDGLFGNPPMHDYPYAASYLVKLMANIGATFSGQIPLFSYWTFSDVFEEQGFPAQEFDKPTNTGWGLVSASGIPKPSYRAFELLHQSGDCLVPVEVIGNDTSVGALVTVDCESLRSNNILAFVWNNVWPSQTASSSVVAAAGDSAFVVFNLGANITSPVKIARIDDTNANAPEMWRKDGRPAYLKPKDVARYKDASKLIWTQMSCSSSSACTLSLQVPQQGLIAISTTRN